jgi:hypothetical protein
VVTGAAAFVTEAVGLVTEAVGFVAGAAGAVVLVAALAGGGVCGAAGAGAGAAGAVGLAGVCGAAGVGAGAADLAGVCGAGATRLVTELVVLAAAWVAAAIGLAGAGAGPTEAAVGALVGTGPSACARAADHSPANARRLTISAPISLKRARNRQRAIRRKLQTLANATGSTPILARPLLN